MKRMRVLQQHFVFLLSIFLFTSCSQGYDINKNLDNSITNTIPGDTVGNGDIPDITPDLSNPNAEDPGSTTGDTPVVVTDPIKNDDPVKKDDPVVVTNPVDIPTKDNPTTDTETKVTPVVVDDGEDPEKPDVVVDVTHPEEGNPNHYCCNRHRPQRELAHGDECSNLKGRHEKVLVCHNGHDILINIQGWCHGHRGLRGHHNDHLGSCMAAVADQKAVEYEQCDND